MTDKGTAGSLATQRRSEGRHWEFAEQASLAGMLAEYLDPAGGMFWTSLENKPLSRLSGMLQKLRGVKSGLPDTQVLFRRADGTVVIFIELKSPRGVPSKTQKKIRRNSLRPAPCGGWREAPVRR